MDVEQVQPTLEQTQQDMRNIKMFRAGAGSDTVSTTKEGFFVGGADFAEAPFGVDFQGNMKATKGTFSGKIEIRDGSNNVVILIDPNASS
jgi:hypothetical protein